MRTHPVLSAAFAQGRHALSEHEGKQLLSSYGLTVTRELLVDSKASLRRAVDEIGLPVALKIDSPDIAHKSDLGLVRLDCGSITACERAYDEIRFAVRRVSPPARVNGVLVQEMVSTGVECIIGAKQDPHFGPVVLFGLGGVFVEVMRDMALRVCPVDMADARAMVTEIKGYALLAGARGRQVADVDAIARAIVSLGRMMEDLGDVIGEVDVNPLIVLPHGSGAVCADALVTLAGNNGGVE